MIMLLTLIILLPAAIGAVIVYIWLEQWHGGSQPWEKWRDWENSQGDWQHSRF